MTILTSLVFTIALFLSARTLLGWGSTLVDRKSRSADTFVIYSALAWGLFYYLTR